MKAQQQAQAAAGSNDDLMREIQSFTREDMEEAIVAEENMQVEKRTYRTMIQLKAELRDVMTASSVELERVFRAFDADHSGTIDREELKKGLASLGAAVSEQTIEDMFSMLDKDGDGSVEYMEFARWFGAGPPPAPTTPEVKARQQAIAASPRNGAHLSAIQGASRAKLQPLELLHKSPRRTAQDPRRTARQPQATGLAAQRRRLLELKAAQRSRR